GSVCDLSDLFPVNSLFSYMGISKSGNPCWFSSATKKNLCYFPCYCDFKLERNLSSEAFYHLSRAGQRAIEGTGIGAAGFREIRAAPTLAADFLGYLGDNF